MKKFLNYFLLVALMAMPLVLTSCGDDDDDEPSGIGDVSMLMGDTWTFQKAVVNIMGQSIEMSYDEILSYMSQEMGTSNLIVVDEKLRFTEDEMILVNTGERVNYRLSSNGNFWFEGLDEMSDSEMSLNVSIYKLTNNLLIFRYKFGMQGMTFTEDLYYTR